jgi:hypothetical protein
MSHDSHAGVFGTITGVAGFGVAGFGTSLLAELAHEGGYLTVKIVTAFAVGVSAALGGYLATWVRDRYLAQPKQPKGPQK